MKPDSSEYRPPVGVFAAGAERELSGVAGAKAEVERRRAKIATGAGVLSAESEAALQGEVSQRGIANGPQSPRVTHQDSKGPVLWHM